MLIASFPETAEIGRKVAKELKVNYTTILTENFPDSEFHLILKKNPRHKTVIILNSLSKNTDEKIVETLLAAGIARDYKAKQVILVATYLPYMRQDKHFEKYDSFSAKHIIKLFKEFDKVIALDPHLHRIKNMKELWSKAESISTNPLIASYLHRKFRDEFAIVGPDEESEQWSSGVAKMLGKKVVILEKTRYNPKHVKIKQRSFPSNNIVIIDDIISTGKTLEEACKMARKQGAKKILCIAIHGIFAGNADKIIRKYADLATTNSIPNKYARIEVSPVIVEALKRYK